MKCFLLPNTEDTAKSTQNCGSKKPDTYIDSYLAGTHEVPFLVRKSGTRTVHATAEFLWLTISHRPHYTL